MTEGLDSLPVEVIADIFSLNDLCTIIALSQVSRLFRDIISDPLLNPWRMPIIQALESPKDSELIELRNLGGRSAVPKQNFIEILSLASPEFILFDATLPTLPPEIWREAFDRRFLPSWRKHKLGDPEQRTFKRTLFTIYHRLNTSCSTQQAWCDYIVIHKGGVVNTLSSYTRTYDPILLFETLKVQSDLAHLDTEARLIVQFKDVRIIALGVLRKRPTFMINPIAGMLIHPPGVTNRVQVDTDGEDDEDDINSPVDSDGDGLHESTTPPTPASPTFPSPSPSFPPHGLASSSGGRLFFRTRSRDSAGPSSPSRSIFRTLSREEGNTDHTQTHRRASSASSIASFAFFRRHIRSGTETHVSSPNLQATTPPQTAIIEGQATVESPQPLLHSDLPITAPTNVPLPQPHRTRTRVRSPSGARSPHRQPIKSATPTKSPYPVLRHPRPIPEFCNYPNFTAGGADRRWKGGDGEEDGRYWVGPMLLTAQLTSDAPHGTEFEASLLGEGRFVSFVLEDLMAIAGPWLRDKIGKSLDGWSLGI